MNPRSAEGAEHESAKTSSRTTRDVKAMITCCGGYVPIEIVSVAFFIAFIISVPISQMYIYNEIAEEHGIHNFVKQDEHPCDNGSTIDNTTLAIQKEASTQFMYISLTSSLPSFIPTLFLGSIADKYSRKAAMLMTFTGLLIKNLIYVLVIQAKLSYKLLYLGNAVEGFSGYYGAVTMAAFGVIADITTPGKQRGLRIALMEAVTATSLAVFQLLAGIAIKYVDFVYPMLVATFFNILAIGLCVIFLPDTLHGQRYPIFKTLSFRYVARSFQFYIKETPTKRRSKLILLLFIALITFAAGFGTSSTNALFVFNRPFCWSEIHFTIFDFVRTVIKWICSVMLVFVVHKFIVQNKDIELIIIGSVSYFASFIMFGTAITSWMLYICKYILYSTLN